MKAALLSIALIVLCCLAAYSQSSSTPTPQPSPAAFTGEKVRKRLRLGNAASKTGKAALALPPEKVQSGKSSSLREAARDRRQA